MIVIILSFKTSGISQTSYTDNQNTQAALRDFLSNFINNISITDINSVTNQAAMLSQLTSQTDQITRNTAVKLFFNFIAIKEMICFLNFNL